MNHTTKKFIVGAVSALAVALPVATMAQVGGAPPGAFAPNLTSLGQIVVNQVWIFFTVIAIVMFVVSGIKFLTSNGDAEKIGEARQSFLWGVARVAVAIIAYTIIAVVRGALGA